jgi:hypothetical protein
MTKKEKEKENPIHKTNAINILDVFTCGDGS